MQESPKTLSLSRVGNIVVEPMNDQVKLYLQGETEF